MICLKNVYFKYKSNLPFVIKNLNLNINEKEKILIAGKNGAGKTTLSKILSGIIPEIENGILQGEILPENLKEKIGILLQDFESQLVTTSVKEELIFFSLNKGLPYKDAFLNAKKLADEFKILNLFERDITTLSGGEKQKIALLSLLSANPEIIILDEPFTDLDPLSREEIIDFLKSRFFNRTIILFEQSLNYFDFFDRIIILNEGEIIYDGTKDIVYKNEILNKAGIELPGIHKIFPGIKKEKAMGYILNNFVFDEEKYNEVKVFNENKETIINISELNYKYSGYNNYVLKNINLEIKIGDFIVVCGQNGSGKTTLMKIIAGILPFKEGKIIKLRENLKTGYIYQNPDNQIFAETVFEEVSFVLKIEKVPFNIIKQKTENILKTMGLFEKKDEDPFSLPKGDRQKIACASILVAEPDVLILDEPTTGLDYPTLKNLMDIIDDMNKKGITVLIITHDMEIAADYGNKILILNNGEILFYGDKRKAFENDEILKQAKIKKTDIMDVTLSANGRLLLNEKEFLLCWSKK